MQMRQQDKWVQAALGALEWMREERSVSFTVVACPSQLGAVILHLERLCTPIAQGLAWPLAGQRLPVTDCQNSAC